MQALFFLCNQNLAAILAAKGFDENPKQRLIVMAIALVVLVVIALVFIIIPEQREKRKRAQDRERLQVGQKIKTSSGIYGTVSAISGEYLFIITGRQGQEVEITRDSVEEIY